MRRPLLWLLLAATIIAPGCRKTQPPTSAADETWRAKASPLAFSAPSMTVANREATIPSACYTRTNGRANPCWVCHTTRNGKNLKADWTLQEQYAFSEVGLTNHWTNLHRDHRPATAKIGDAEVLAYIREDNLSPLRAAATAAGDFPGYSFDLDYRQGFDDEGFARDGSGWRAFVYKPFAGTFWPTNGATDDVLIRLPAPFRRDADGKASRTIYQANLAVLEAAMTVSDLVADVDLERAVEPQDEIALGVDLDGDGALGTATRLRGLPAHYLGGARAIPVRRWEYPEGTEFIHSVRYVDPEAPNLLSARAKELRYSRKTGSVDASSNAALYKEAAIEKLSGQLPYFQGGPERGTDSSFGWRYQGWIEDAQGRLRLQNAEEQLFCMGCHGGIGITVDSSFGFPRKRPGKAGWGWQSLTGLFDAPQAGHVDGEVLTYFRRVGGGDELRANTEVLARFFPGGVLDEAAVKTASDLRTLIAPSPERALALNKAYWALVREQDFVHGRDTVLAPAVNVLDTVKNGDTELRKAKRVYSDGRLWLDWPADADTPAATAPARSQ